ncbi:hypothetical protein [Amycolatopsis speibonae]
MPDSGWEILTKLTGGNQGRRPWNSSPRPVHCAYQRQDHAALVLQRQ